MSGNTRIGGRFGESVMLALIYLVLAPMPALADDDKPGDEPVGWPMRSSDKELMNLELRRQQATPMPQRSEVSDQALAAWTDDEPAMPGSAATLDMSPLPAGGVPTGEVDAIDLPADSNSAATPARIASPEIAPLKRIIPPVRHELIVYAPGDFSIGVGTAERLEQMAMRLRGTRDRISIVAHSSTGPGPGPGDAQISTHEAVKLSFKRAMLVRLYLIEEGVSPDQIDLQALPQSDDGGPRDRVEISATSKAARR